MVLMSKDSFQRRLDELSADGCGEFAIDARGQTLQLKFRRNGFELRYEQLRKFNLSGGSTYGEVYRLMLQRRQAAWLEYKTWLEEWEKQNVE